MESPEPNSKEKTEENVVKDVYRKHSSGDLHSRLKTRKMLGVGETDNGDIHRSKISQLLGHNEHLYVKFPRGYWCWHLMMALNFTILGINNLFLPDRRWAAGFPETDQSHLASRYYGCASITLALMMWAFWGTSDKGIAKSLLTVIAMCHVLHAVAMVLEQLEGSWYFYLCFFLRILFVVPSVYFYRGIGHCGLRMRKSNSFGNLKDSTSNSQGSWKAAN